MCNFTTWMYRSSAQHTSFCWIPLCSGIIPVNDSSLDRCWLIAFMGAIKQLFSSLTTTPGNAPTNCTYNCTHFKGNNTRTSSRAGRQAERKAEESPLTEPCSAIKPFFMAHFNPAEPWPAVLYCNWGRLNSFMQLFQATLFFNVCVCWIDLTQRKSFQFHCFPWMCEDGLIFLRHYFVERVFFVL